MEERFVQLLSGQKFQSGTQEGLNWRHKLESLATTYIKTQNEIKTPKKWANTRQKGPGRAMWYQITKGYTMKKVGGSNKTKKTS